EDYEGIRGRAETWRQEFGFQILSTLGLNFFFSGGRRHTSSYGDWSSDVRYVWRHLPLNDVHPSAQLMAEAVEAAHAQGRFWEMYDALLSHEGSVTAVELGNIAERLGLDIERFWAELRRREHAPRLARDVAIGDASDVSGTPTFFING